MHLLIIWELLFELGVRGGHGSLDEEEGRRLMATARKRGLFGVLFALALAVGLLPGMALTAHADDYYDLWVGGVQVTSANMNDVLVDDPDNKGKVSYNPETSTLTLNGATITQNNGDRGNVITCGSGQLNIVLSSSNTVGSTDSNRAIEANGPVTISGDGSLNAAGKKMAFGLAAA